MSRLYLKAENYAGRTVISESFFSAPLKIAKPFYHENFTTVMMMSASAGMLDGDCYDIEIKVCTGARLRFTGQSFNKIFRSTSGKGVAQKVKITVESGGELIYSKVYYWTKLYKFLNPSGKVYLKVKLILKYVMIQK